MTLCGESEYKSPAFPSLTVCASSNCFVAAQTARRSVSFAVSPTGFASASFALACAHDFGVEPFAIGPGMPTRLNPLDPGPLATNWGQLDKEEQHRRQAIIFGRWLVLLRSLIGSQSIGDRKVAVGPTEEQVLKAVLVELTHTNSDSRELRPIVIPQVWQQLHSPSDELVAELRYPDRHTFLDDTRLLRDAVAQLISGSFAGIFDALGLQVKMPDWLLSIAWAKPAIMLMGIWTAVGGTNMLLYLAGISNVPPELYEAAEIDGAGRWAMFRHVTWPQLAPTTFFIVVMSAIGGLQGGFEQARVMTGGGPAESTITLGYFIYQKGFEEYQLGYASAIAWVMFLMIFALTLVNWKFGKSAFDVEV